MDKSDPYEMPNTPFWREFMQAAYTASRSEGPVGFLVPEEFVADMQRVTARRAQAEAFLSRWLPSRVAKWLAWRWPYQWLPELDMDEEKG